MSKAYDKLRMRILRVEKKLGIYQPDPTNPEPEYSEVAHKAAKELKELDEMVRRGLGLQEIERVCDLCGGRFGKSCYHSGLSKDSTPPLHARVAKALGHEVWLDDWGKWCYDPRNVKEGNAYPVIPCYDLDDGLAMGAFREYALKIRKGIKILMDADIQHNPQKKWWVHLLDTSINEFDANLALAICRAIVAHAEGK